jgi:hypothetical protein
MLCGFKTKTDIGLGDDDSLVGKGLGWVEGVL